VKVVHREKVLYDWSQVEGLGDVLDDDGLVEGRVVGRSVLDDLGQGRLAREPLKKFVLRGKYFNF